MVGQALAAATAGTELPLVTTRDGEIVGSTRFLALRPEHGSVEIGGHGSTRPRGAPARTSTRSSSSSDAFEEWGCRRVGLKTDALNERSRRALEAIGATFEGFTASTCSCRAGRTETARGTASPTTSGRPFARSSRRGWRQVGRPVHCRCPVSATRNWSEMIETIEVIGAGGRVGSAVSARLGERGLAWTGSTPSSSCSVFPTGRSPTWRRRSPPALGGAREWRDPALGARPARGASGCTRCSRSRRPADRNSSTAPGRR